MSHVITGLPSLESEASSPIHNEINTLCGLNQYSDKSFDRLSTLIYTEHKLTIIFKAPPNIKTNLHIPTGNRDFSFDKIPGIKLPQLSIHKEYLLPRPSNLPKKLDLNNHGYQDTPFTITINPYALISSGKSVADVENIIMTHVTSAKRIVEINHVLNVFDNASLDINKVKDLKQVSDVLKQANLITRDLKPLDENNKNPEIDVTKAISSRIKELMSNNAVDQINSKNLTGIEGILIIALGAIILNAIVLFLARILIKYIFLGILGLIKITAKLIYNIIVTIFGGDTVPLLGLYNGQAIAKLKKIGNDYIINPIISLSKGLSYYITNKGEEDAAVS